MRIGWRQLIKQKLRKSSDYHAVGIAFTADQVLLCAFKKQKNDYVWSLDASFTHQSWQKMLPKYVQENKLSGAPCYFALSSHWYRIHQVDKPDVGEADLFNALQWPIKEALATDKELVYDYADLPVQVSGQNKVLAIGVDKEEIRKLTEVIYASDLSLKSIVVEEFATTYLLPPSSEPVITLVQEHGEVVVLNIVKDNQLYLTRRLKGFEQIGSYSQDELKMGITDSICVQIQRSMDFFESQLRQAPIRKILLKLDSPHSEFLAQQIGSAMGAVCEVFKPNIICAEELNFKMASFSCIGAAYTGLISQENHKKIKPKDSEALKKGEVA